VAQSREVHEATRDAAVAGVPSWDVPVIELLGNERVAASVADRHTCFRNGRSSVEAREEVAAILSGDSVAEACDTTSCG
jgi:hypothetical protein